MTRRITAILLAVLLFASMLTPVAAAAVSGGDTAIQAENETVTNTTTTTAPSEEEIREKAESDSGYTKDGLQKSGTMDNDEFPSLRWLDDYTAIWMVKYNTGPQAAFGDDEYLKYLEPEDTIHRDRIQLVGNFPKDGETREYKLKIVYWKVDSKRVQTENGTTNVNVLNVTGEDTKVVELDDGIQSTANISLRSHYDTPVRMSVMMVDDGGDTIARWGPYTHDSIESTASLPFGNSWTEFIPWVIPRFVIFTGLGAMIAAVAGFSLAKKVGGFGKSFIWWGLATLVIGGTVLFSWYERIVEIIVFAPYLLGFPVIAGVFLVVAEVAQPALRARLEYPDIQEVEDELGEKRAHMEGEAGDDIWMIERDDGLGFMRYGKIRNALARWKAGMALVPYKEIEKRYPYGGNSSTHEKFYVEGYDFTPAHWEWELPPLKETVDVDGESVEQWRSGAIASGALVVLFGYLVGGGAFNAPLLGTAAGVGLVLATGINAVGGDMDIDFADGASVSAKTARLVETEERMKFKSIQQAIESLGETESKTWRKVYAFIRSIQQESDRVEDELYDMADGGFEIGQMEVDDDGAVSTIDNEVMSDGGQ